MESSRIYYGDENIYMNKYTIYKSLQCVTVMAITNRVEMIPNIINNFNSQTYPYKELIIGVNSTGVDLERWERKYRGYGLIRFYRINDEVSLGGCYNYIAPLALFGYIAHFDDDDYYAPKYLADMMSLCKAQEADLYGKKTSFVYFKSKKLLALRNVGMEHSFVYHMDGPTLFYKKVLIEEIPFPDITLGVDSEYCRIVQEHGKKIFSGSRFNHAYIRRGDGSHTWSVNEEELLHSCHRIGVFESFENQVLE